MLSPKVRDLIECLIREASKEGILIAGFVGDVGDDTDQPFMTFSNMSERGAEIARVFQLAADLIEQCAEDGRIQEVELGRPS